ncbi:MAG: protease modulator HflC [Myxococcales bacterium]|jgi:membrane protease subunit HflC|nr:protease modulator HflC [Myxococcales bacterium]
MKKLLIIIGLLPLVAYVAATAFLSVRETEWVVITQFGRPERVIERAGLSLKLPDPFQTAIRIDKRLQPLDTAVREYLTQDKKNVMLGAFLVWRVQDPMRFIQSVRTLSAAEQRLTDLVASELGSAVSSFPLSDYLSLDEKGSKLRAVMGQVTLKCAQQAGAEFGIEVLSVRLRRFGFPEQNLQSVYSRMRAERERIAKKYRAEGEEEASNLRSETEKEVRELLASAYRDAQIQRGKGDAEAIRIYAEAFEQDPNYYKLTRTLQAYQRFLDSETTLILSTDSPLFRYLEAPPEVAP